MCHLIVSRMQRTTIRELKHSTTKVLSLVAAGASVEVRRYNRPVAVLSPPARKAAGPRPDFAQRLKEIYGVDMLKTTGSQLVSELRGAR